MPKTKIPNPAEGLFNGIPKINEFFERTDTHIRYFRKSKYFPDSTKEVLISRRELLLDSLKKMDEIDLRLLFYLQQVNGASSFNLYKLLQKEYRAQCERKNYLEHTDIYQDPFL